jgi:hypothetical protein
MMAKEFFELARYYGIWCKYLYHVISHIQKHRYNLILVDSIIQTSFHCITARHLLLSIQCRRIYIVVFIYTPIWPAEKKKQQISTTKTEE